MGCVNSTGASGTGEKYGSANPEDILLTENQGKSNPRERSEDAGFQKWSEMENAEEMTFITDEQGDASLEKLLDREFPVKVERQQSDFSSVQFWLSKLKSIDSSTNAVPETQPGFHLKPPWTMEQARSLYRYLSKPRDERLKSGEPCIPRKCVYTLLVDAFAMLEKQANESGALQHVVPPTNASEKLYVCGDTHGQLQDVLWIFELHGLPSAKNRYLFNGDIADRGANALEIFMLLFAFKLAEPTCLYINRGNHEQRDLNERPFANGGGFAWELREKYPHDEHLIELFQRIFVLFPIAALVGQWAFVIHGGLFRQAGVTLDDIAKTDNRRQPPLKLDTRDDEILFDALWADPHDGDGVVQGSTRGGFSIQFGADVTKDFCKRTGVKSVIRSHQLPKKMRGFEILHDSMLLTIFSASNYGGVCRNRGGVLVFDEKGPAEVKEFYAPTLDQIREMYDTRMVQKVMPKVDKWRNLSRLGTNNRASRQKRREGEQKAHDRWVYLLEDVNENGALSAEAMAEVQQEQSKLAGRRSSSKNMDMTSDRSKTRRASSKCDEPDDRSHLQRHSLVSQPLRGDQLGEKSSQRVHQIVFTNENEAETRKHGDILRAMLTELCRHKAELMNAFAAAEADGVDGSKRKSAKSELSYNTWLDVLCDVFPVYSSLWREYAPKLTPEGMAVPYRRWLDRFQVRLQFDHYSEFERLIMQTIGERLGAKTREMSLNQLLAYFDPDRSGAVDALELHSILEGLDLGLSKVQLQQLRYELGFTNPEGAAHPVEVMVTLLQRLPLATRDKRTSEQTERLETMLNQIRDMIRQNNKIAREAFNTKLLELFQSADTDANGLLSYDETASIITQLQEKCLSSIATGADVAPLVEYIDLDGSGAVTFLEFVASLGLTQSAEVEMERRSSSSSDSSLAVLIMEQICAALYQLDHALQKAFTRIDTTGTGWMPLENFSKALQLVASLSGAEHRTIDNWQIAALVESLKGSNLCDAQGQVDYAKFVQSFYIVDTKA
ncbi:hypothetical protein AB1Y20_007854 [Prymnesium parvum]|uniref:Serine/threonine-protein phosphatase n=1 Tax=Prymnesium parvum TaxID=97485 RepID=A0AB34IUW8_PRYPA